mmetsp:Transcript_14511/g.24080  ORF Transcript_14511/g.24080 Transcript_14511/m.24080 type:complete len:218 (+) Transcript_14511:912-1565(+)
MLLLHTLVLLALLLLLVRFHFLAILVHCSLLHGLPLRTLRLECVQTRLLPLLLVQPPLLLKEFGWCKHIQELLVPQAVFQTFLVLGHLTAQGLNLLGEALDLLGLLLLSLGLLFRLFDSIVGLLVVLFQKGIKTHRILLQHLFRPLQGLLLHLRFLLQLADLLPLRVETHLHKKHFSLLRNELSHVFFLLSPGRNARLLLSVRLLHIAQTLRTAFVA